MYFGILFVLFVVWFYFRLKKSNQDRTTLDDFQERERAVNAVRKQDISCLDYLNIPVSELPFDPAPAKELAILQNAVLDLAGETICNLNGISNTQLKAAYGPANLDALTRYDDAYTRLSVALANWGSYLYQHGKHPEARLVLEYAITTGTDISRTFVTLGHILIDSGEMAALDQLIQTASQLDSLMKDSILEQLYRLKSQSL